MFLPYILLLHLLHYGRGGHVAVAPTNRVEGELAEPDNLLVAHPGVPARGKEVDTSENNNKILQFRSLKWF